MFLFSFCSFWGDENGMQVSSRNRDYTLHVTARVLSKTMPP